MIFLKFISYCAHYQCSITYYHNPFQVTVVVDPGQSLGLMVRGGLEFALGIYVSGVDQESVAEQVGIKVRICQGWIQVRVLG